MKFLKFKNSVDEFKDSYGSLGKAKAAGKLFGILAVNTAILTGKIVAKLPEHMAKEIEKKKR